MGRVGRTCPVELDIPSEFGWVVRGIAIFRVWYRRVLDLLWDADLLRVYYLACTEGFLFRRWGCGLCRVLQGLGAVFLWNC